MLEEGGMLEKVMKVGTDLLLIASVAHQAGGEFPGNHHHLITSDLESVFADMCFVSYIRVPANGLYHLCMTNVVVPIAQQTYARPSSI